MPQTRLEHLISVVGLEGSRISDLTHKMNIDADAVICDQCSADGYIEYTYISQNVESHDVRCYIMADRGVGLSRNTVLMHARAELCLFGDDDIVYDDGYLDKVIAEFDAHPEADMLLFNVRQSEGRQTYENTGFGRIKWYNYGRYPAYAIGFRRDALLKSGVMFSLLFGGGARYSNGEDSLFLHDALKKKMRIYKTSTVIGKEENRKSTWFNGYTDKFFIDRGILYKYLYGCLAKAFAFRFLLKNQNEMCRDKSLKECYKLMKKGIQEA